MGFDGVWGGFWFWWSFDFDFLLWILGGFWFFAMNFWWGGFQLVGLWLDFGFRLVGLWIQIGWCVVVWWWRDGWCLVIVGHVGLLLLCSSLLTVLVWFKMILGGGWYDYVCSAEVGGVTRKLDGGGGGGGWSREREREREIKIRERSENNFILFLFYFVLF